MALGGRWVQNLSFRHDGLDKRLRIGAELVALPGKPVTAEALAHMMLMAASCGVAAELYRQAAAQLDRLGQAGAGLGILGRSSLLIMQDRMAEITSELDGDPRMPAPFPEPSCPHSQTARHRS